jgi:hypothetical protein
MITVMVVPMITVMIPMMVPMVEQRLADLEAAVIAREQPFRPRMVS